MAKLDRLRSAGVEELWHLPLYCPTEFKDYSQCFESFDPRFLLEGGYGVFRGVLTCSPETLWKNKRPRTQFTIYDGIYSISFVIFGDTRALVKDMVKGGRVCVDGIVAKYSNKLFLNDAEIIPDNFMGKIVPKYKGVTGKISPEAIRLLISNNLDEAIPVTAQKIRDVLSVHMPAWCIRKYVDCQSMTLEQVFEQLHRPKNEDNADIALYVMKRLANLLAAEQLLSRAKEVGTQNAPPIIGMDPNQLTKGIPFRMTSEQMEQANIAIEQMFSGKLFNGLLVGDVGTGKTVVYGLIAAYVASAGHRVAIMLPNQNLARQIHEDLNEYFGMLGVGLITARHQSELISDKRILVGTTALLFRDIGQVSLVIVDEQQKLATSQREQLRDSHTHLLEVSATPIPRTMAYALYGAVTLLHVRKCHVDKTIHTKIYDANAKRELFKAIEQTIGRGKKVLIVCPKCKEGGEVSHLISAHKLAQDFERFAPGKIALSYSKLEDVQNIEAIRRIKSGEAKILISTTFVEVGMNIPELERVVAMNADRYALQQLHQLRGRAVRAGGVGFFDMYLPNQITNQTTIDRMNIMVEVCDGYEIAKHDLKLRGTGDLSKIGETQHGNMTSLIKNIRGDLDDIEAVIEEVNSYNAQAHQRAS
jgi:ATP-dependent DNA helicase RecG